MRAKIPPRVSAAVYGYTFKCTQICMLGWTRINWSMKMGETSRGEDKKLHVNNYPMASSDKSDGGTTSRVIQSLLTWLSDKGAPVFVIATANDITKLPAELTRAGRFDDIFFVSLPSQNEREEILKIHLRKRGYTVSDPQGDLFQTGENEFTEHQISTLATEMKDFTGAEIEQVVAEAGRRAYASYRKKQRKSYYITESDIAKQSSKIVPLSRRNPELLTELRSWAKHSAKCASSEEHKLIHNTSKKKATLVEVDFPDLDI